MFLSQKECLYPLQLAGTINNENSQGLCCLKEWANEFQLAETTNKQTKLILQKLKLKKEKKNERKKGNATRRRSNKMIFLFERSK